LNGGFADVWLGLFDGERVAIKALRVPLVSGKDRDEEETSIRRLYRELKTWASTNHENVLPLYGYALDLEITRFAALISPFQENGRSLDYLVDKDPKIRLAVVLGAGEGLAYLHGICKVVHGDFRGDNILISKEGVPRVADFGLSRILTHSASMITKRTNPGGNARWMSVELLQGKTTESTQESDVWAFGMTVLELMTLRAPFSHIRGDYQVIMAVARGERPHLDDLPQALRAICTECWFELDLPNQTRPTMEGNVREIKLILENWD